MMSITTYELAKRDFERLEKEIKRLEKEIKPIPEGRLAVYTVRGSRRFYQICRDPETHKTNRTYISSFDKARIKKLADKTLNIAILQDKREEYQRLKTYLDSYEHKLKRAQKRLENVKELREICNYFTPLEKKYQDWEDAVYPVNPIENKAGIKSVLGVDVRSKSEAYIALKLKEKGLAVRYECELQLKHSKVYPDFTILDPRSGRIYLWEHLGMMDDEEYAAHADRKMMDYVASGYHPMINLILTSETKDSPLDFALVDHLIEYYFA